MKVWLKTHVNKFLKGNTDHWMTELNEAFLEAQVAHHKFLRTLDRLGLYGR